MTKQYEPAAFVYRGDGLEAIHYYAKNQDNVDLVILDLTMPNMNGEECFYALKELNPDVKVILSTGFGFNVTVQRLIDDGGGGLW